MAEKPPVSRQLKNGLTWLLPQQKAKRSARRLKRSSTALFSKKPVLGGDNKFNVIVDPSLPDDEKTGKQKRREARADDESYVLDEGVSFGEYDLILYGLSGMGDAHVQFEAMRKGKQEDLKDTPVNAIVRRRFCPMCAKMGLLSLMEHEAHVAVVLLREMNKFTPEYLQRVHRILIEGRELHVILQELEEHIPNMTLAYSERISWLTAKAKLKFQGNECSHFTQHIAPVCAFSWALVHQNQEEKEENEHLSP